MDRQNWFALILLNNRTFGYENVYGFLNWMTTRCVIAGKIATNTFSVLFIDILNVYTGIHEELTRLEDEAPIRQFEGEW